MPDDPELVSDLTDEQAAEEEILSSESEFDELFPTIPELDDPTPADQDLALVDDLADFAADGNDEDDVDPATDPVAAAAAQGDDLAFDWASGELWATETGQLDVVTGEDAVLERLLKRLNIDRGRWAIYSPEYGTRVRELIGSMPSGLAEAELSRQVESACLGETRVTQAKVTAIEPVPNLAPDVRLVTVEIRLDTSDDTLQLDVTI